MERIEGDLFDTKSGLDAILHRAMSQCAEKIVGPQWFLDAKEAPVSLIVERLARNVHKQQDIPIKFWLAVKCAEAFDRVRTAWASRRQRDEFYLFELDDAFAGLRPVEGRPSEVNHTFFTALIELKEVRPVKDFSGAARYL